MLTRELDVTVHALSYLVTLLIQRQHLADPKWSARALDEIRVDRLNAHEYGAQAEFAEGIFSKALEIVERAIELSSSAPARGSPHGKPHE